MSVATDKTVSQPDVVDVRSWLMAKGSPAGSRLSEFTTVVAMILFGIRLLFYETRFNCGARISHEAVEVVAVGLRIDGLVDCQSDMARNWKFLEARQDMEGTVDCQGDDGEVELDRETVGPAFEGAHLAGPCAGALGEDHERHASAQLALGIGHSAAGGGDRGVVDENLPGPAACPADEGYLAQALLHHPAEIVAEIAVDGKNIIGSLVVGDEDIADSRVNVLAPSHRDPNEGEPAEEPRPQNLGIVAEPPPHSEGRTDDCHHGCDYRRHNEQRAHHENLINTIENQHREYGMCDYLRE